MSGMVERVAKAILAEENPDSADQYTATARAAIKAMREPTEDMVLAGLRAASTQEKYQAMIDEALK